MRYNNKAHIEEKALKSIWNSWGKIIVSLIVSAVILFLSRPDKDSELAGILYPAQIISTFVFWELQYQIFFVDSKGGLANAPLAKQKRTHTKIGFHTVSIFVMGVTFTILLGINFWAAFGGIAGSSVLWFAWYGVRVKSQRK